MSSLGRWVVEIFLLGVRGMEEGGKGCRIVRYENMGTRV